MQKKFKNPNPSPNLVEESIDDITMSDFSNFILVEFELNTSIELSGMTLDYGRIARECNQYGAAPSFGTVVKVPNKLFYDKDNVDSMDWDTDLELEIGDKAWFQRTIFLNSPKVFIGKKMYVSMRYNDVYLRERDGILGAINGYCLVELDRVPQDDVLINLDAGSENNLKGVVILSSTPVREYYNGDIESIELSEGKNVLFSDKYRIELEDKLFKKIKDKRYYVIQPREVSYVFS